MIISSTTTSKSKSYWFIWFIATVALFIIAVTLSVFFNTAHAAIDVYEFDTPQQEEQYRGLIEELRCPKCQNQNLAGSDSQISKDLKRKTYELVMDGKSDAQIRDYMYERYGDFISYKPPVRPTTWILWFFPPLFLIALIGWWLWRSSRNNQAIAVSSNDDLATLESGMDHQSDDDVIESGLSTEESDSLKAILKQHSSDQPKSIHRGEESSGSDDLIK